MLYVVMRVTGYVTILSNYVIAKSKGFYYEINEYSN